MVSHKNFNIKRGEDRGYLHFCLVDGLNDKMMSRREKLIDGK